MGEENLRNKALRGAMWTFLDQVGTRGISFVIGIILARLLAPAEYGLLGMVAVFTAVAWMFIDSGFSQAMVRKPNLTEEDKLTAFWYSLGMGFLMYLILFFSAPYIADFYNQPKLTSIVRVVSIPLLASPFSSIPNLMFTRDINFKVTTKISFVCTIMSGIVGIFMAFAGYGVWALIFQGLTSGLISVIMRNFYCRWHLRFVFSKNSFHYLWGFGNKMLISSMINTIYTNIYPIVIGKFFSPAILGQYQKANDYSCIFSSTLTSVVQRVSFPTLSKMQNDSDRLKSGYRKIIKMSMLLSSSGCLAMAAMAKPLIVILIGEKWIMCSEYLQIICFGALLYPVHAINLNVLTVMGRSDLFLKLEIIKKIVCFFPIIVGVFLGIKLMLLAGVLSGFISFAINAYYSKDLINYSFIQQFRDILPYIVVAVFVGSIAWTITLFPINIFLQFFLQVILFLFLIITYYEYKKQSEYIELKKIFLSWRNNIILV